MFGRQTIPKYILMQNQILIQTHWLSQKYTAIISNHFYMPMPDVYTTLICSIQDLCNSIIKVTFFLSLKLFLRFSSKKVLQLYLRF